MLGIDELLDYIIDGVEFDVYDINTEKNIAEGLSDDEIREWHENHDYELCSLEPTQRKDANGNTVFGITFNVDNVESTDEEDDEDEDEEEDY